MNFTSSLFDVRFFGAMIHTSKKRMMYRSHLAAIPGSRRIIRVLLKYFSIEQISQSVGVDDLKHIGIADNIAQEFIIRKNAMHPEKAYGDLLKCGATLLMEKDAEYPLLLKQIPSPPLFLYRLGNSIPLHNCIAVVGSRRITSYGRMAVEKIVRELVDADMCVVSGLAYGIDAKAHEVTIKNGGKTFAVTASGIDSMYPIANTRLAREIVETGGAIFTEFPMGTKAVAHNFPSRNRIIAGMSHATLVIQAQKKSGALITASFALDYGRDVGAVPGSIFDEQMEGCLELLSTGATPVRSATDILEPMGIRDLPASPKKARHLSDAQKKLFDLLAVSPRDIDSLSIETGKPVAELMALLTELEMGGIISFEGQKIALQNIS
jgi:DNA processing protein